MEEKIDKMIDMLVDLAYNETERAKARNYFSKDLAEAVGIVISMSKGKKNDK